MAEPPPPLVQNVSHVHVCWGKFETLKTGMIHLTGNKEDCKQNCREKNTLKFNVEFVKMFMESREYLKA